MTRRHLLGAAAAAAVLETPVLPAAENAGRIKQSVARWCYSKMSLDDLCRNSASIGLKGIDLVNHDEWETLRKYGLTPTMTSGAGSIPDGWNRKENHDKLEKEMRDNIANAAAAKVPNVITFSGNRRGMPDAEGRDNCVAFLRRIKAYAEEQGRHRLRGAAQQQGEPQGLPVRPHRLGRGGVQGVDSPRVKLLYDIYHMQIMEGDVIRTIRENIQYIGHFHTGGVPGRHELDDTQELNWRAVATAIADLNFQGFVAHEFVRGGVPGGRVGVPMSLEGLSLCLFRLRLVWGGLVPSFVSPRRPAAGPPPPSAAAGSPG